MPNWAGYDTASFLYSAPRAGMSGSCNPNGYNLAKYTIEKYTQTADKYFARYFLTPGNFSPFDPAEINAMRAATTYALMPISATTRTRLETSGETGKQYGRDDATTTLQRVIAALNSGYGLVVPSSRVVYVYLNIEQDYQITAWYWEGWSETVYWYSDPTHGLPFYPAAYANPNDIGTMNMLASYSADAQHTCYGLWTTQPSASSTNCQWCNNAPPPAWTSTSVQGYPGLTLHHWQYTIDGICYPGSGCDSCRPAVDQDQSNPAFDMATYMLQVTP